MRTTVGMFATLLVLGWTSVPAAYDQRTHREIGQRAAEPDVSSLDPVLKAELGIINGIVERFPGISESGLRTVRELIGDGAFSEDVPDSRVLNHFHNPLAAPWAGAGLRMLGVDLGQASVLWQQNPGQDSVAGGGNWSWQNARRHFLNALTVETHGDRERAFASTFEALGHVSHLIQDASVPAHVRNDPHPSFTLLGFRIGNPDWYEDWVEENRAGLVGALLNSLIERPTGSIPPPDSIFSPTVDDQAPVPIARLIDADKFQAELRNVQVTTDDPAIGISEYTNGNFLSRDTLFKNFVFPRQPGLDAAFVVPEGTKFRRYFSKVADGERIQFFVTEGTLHREMRAALGGPPPVGGWFLDDRVHQEYAGKLIPRAVGYSADLLDYFFRGKLDLDLVEDPSDSSRIQLIGANGATSDELVNGTLTLYSDDPAGARSQVLGFSPMVLTSVKPGDPLSSSPLSFQPPEKAERFVAVYQGTLGLEKKEGTFPGGVIGKVLGGVRVEEVFSDGVRWKLRTPKGVFLLPLMRAEFEEVRWGDGDNILVARTPFGRPDPNQRNRNRVVAYELQRQPGSVELVTVDTPDGPEAQVTKQTEALFPFGISLGTTVQFSQSIQYRQQLAKFDPRKTVLRFEKHPEICPNCAFYILDHVEIGSLQIQTVVEQAIPFSETFLVRLDLERNLDFGTVAQPYIWSLQEVTADAAGRLLGVVVVFLLAPESPAVTVPFFGLNQAGAQEVVAQVPIFPFFPPEVTTLLWAVVDLNAQSVVASTADPTIVIASRMATEAPAWVVPNSSPAPLVYAHFIEQRTGGGPNDGIDDQGWAGLRLQQVAPFPSLSVTELQTQQGERAFSAEGWPRRELKDELIKNGLLSFQVSVNSRTVPTDFLYDCPSDLCFGLRVTTSDGFVAHPPVQLQDARRSRPAPGGERLVFLARGLTPPFWTILVWDASPPRARVLQQFPTDFPSLGSATRAAVLASTLSFDGPQVLSTDFLFPLEGTQGPTVFQGVDVNTSFALILLNPSFLYSIQDLKFFGSTPPLRRTALPATLADLPDQSNPIGDYHAIRVP